MTSPAVVSKKNYKFTGWDKALKGSFNEDTVISAQFVKLNNVIVPDDPSEPVPENYVKVTFDKGGNGETH